MLGIPAAAFADSETALLVRMNDGVEHTLHLTSLPVISFPEDGAKVRFSTKEGPALEYDLAEVVNYKFISTENGVREIPFSNTLSEALKVDGDIVYMSGLRPGETVNAFNAGGLPMRQTSADEEGSAILSLDGLLSGVYIVKCGRLSVKVIIR